MDVTRTDLSLFRTRLLVLSMRIVNFPPVIFYLSNNNHFYLENWFGNFRFCCEAFDYFGLFLLYYALKCISYVHQRNNEDLQRLIDYLTTGVNNNELSTFTTTTKNCRCSLWKFKEMEKNGTSKKCGSTSPRKYVARFHSLLTPLLWNLIERNNNIINERIS